MRTEALKFSKAGLAPTVVYRHEGYELDFGQDTNVGWHQSGYCKEAVSSVQKTPNLSKATSLFSKAMPLGGLNLQLHNRPREPRLLAGPAHIAHVWQKRRRQSVSITTAATLPVPSHGEV